MPIQNPRKTFVACLVGLGLASPCLADEWTSARTVIVNSPDGQWRGIVIPSSSGEASTPSRHAIGHVQGDDRSTRRPDRAYARMQRREEGRWMDMWEGALANPHAPVEALVSDKGFLITLDEWLERGYGENVVVTYDEFGRIRCHWELDDLLPTLYVEHLPTSVSSRRWRGTASIDPTTRRVRVPIALPSGMKPAAHGEPPGSDATTITLGIDPESCAIDPPDQAAWTRVTAYLEAAQQVRDAEIAESEARLETPLVAPIGTSPTDWGDYLADALRRLAGLPDMTPERSPVVWVEDRDSSDLATSLDEASSRATTLILGSMPPALLIDALAATANRIPHAALSSSTMYLVLDDAHFAKAASLLAASGARLVQVDPSVPIPQSAANLAEFAAWKAERSAERDERRKRPRRHSSWWQGM
ncbi:hypothetical protein ACQQ2N_14380 [Dokdonella sp. MW10]|uniref:hypothetical protein n=1 Tax=Dokdonella sp. MW10 TaxID=2992926 RepID=UPI003F7E0DA9